MYLYKDIFKGHDRASMDIQVDEIKRYIDTRYVVPPEACWRLFEFALHDKSHIIERLAVHVPENKRTVFERGHEAEALEKAKTTQSTLEAWFILNSKDEKALQYTYAEIPEHYTWQRQATVKLENLTSY